MHSVKLEYETCVNCSDSWQWVTGDGNGSRGMAMDHMGWQWIRWDFIVLVMLHIFVCYCLQNNITGYMSDEVLHIHCLYTVYEQYIHCI